MQSVSQSVGVNYLRGHFVSHRSACATGSAVLGFLTQEPKAVRSFETGGLL